MFNFVFKLKTMFWYWILLDFHKTGPPCELHYRPWPIYRWWTGGQVFVGIVLPTIFFPSDGNWHESIVASPGTTISLVYNLLAEKLRHITSRIANPQRLSQLGASRLERENGSPAVSTESKTGSLSNLNLNNSLHHSLHTSTVSSHVLFYQRGTMITLRRNNRHTYSAGQCICDFFDFPHKIVKFGEFDLRSYLWIDFLLNFYERPITKNPI